MTKTEKTTGIGAEEPNFRLAIYKGLHENEVKISHWLEKYKQESWKKAMKKHKGDRIKAYMNDQIQLK